MSILDDAWSAISNYLFETDPLEYGNKNRSYMLGIYPNNNKKGPIYAYLPDEVQFTFGSTYENVLERIGQQISSTLTPRGNNIFSTLVRWAGKTVELSKSIQSNFMTFDGKASSAKEYTKNFISWSSSNRLILKLPIVLLSWSSEEDALNAYTSLCKMALVRNGSSSSGSNNTGISYLEIPGPRLNNIKSGEDIINLASTAVGLDTPVSNIKDIVNTDRCVTISLGQYARVPNMVLKSVTGSVKSAFTEKGYPLYIGTTLDLESIFPMTAEDIDTIFNIDKNNEITAAEQAEINNKAVENTKTVIKGIIGG